MLVLIAGSLYAGDGLRVRLAWGGGAERLWQGTVALSKGTLSEPHPLGIEADEPGSMWLEEGQLVIRQRSPRAYDGVDLVVDAPKDAKLLVQLIADGEKPRDSLVEIPLEELVGEVRSRPLDDRDNVLLVRRAPGDSLRVRLDRKSLVFAPGEKLRIEVEPYRIAVAADSKLRLRTQLLEAVSQREVWSANHDFRSAPGESLPVEIPIPQDEGVYDVSIAVLPGSNWPHPVRPALNWKKPVAERRVQLMVLAAARPPAGKSREMTTVMEIDPAAPRWWEKVKLPQLARLARPGKGPLGNGSLETIRHPLGEVARLKANADSPDVSWEAYALTVNQPGRPHILEVDYPSDVPQTLGISIVEPNAAGAMVPIGLDSGVDVAEEMGREGPPRWLRHRLVFWPRTTAPLVMMTNRRDQAPAVYGKIRLLAGWDRLPRPRAAEYGPLPAAGLRTFAAYLDRPLIPENFLATESLDASTGRSLDDWQTFYEAGTRLVDYLQYAGNNALVINVLADGSGLYPSDLLEPTPRYDTGVFFGNGQDPIRKDALEMLLRLFDREQLQFVPSIEFAAPLPQLEAIRRRGGDEAAGLEWIGPEGTPWSNTYSPRRGLAPYYNTLDPRVQEAMLAVVHELVERSAHHASFAGLAIRLSAYGYAQLPGPEWGMDDATIARFERDTGIKVPGEGPQRFAARWAVLNSDARRPQWLAWRAGQLHRFYRRLHAELTAVRPGASLLLAGAEMLAGPELERELRPTLPRRATLADSLLRAGIDLRHYQEDGQIVLLRPERVLPAPRLSASAVDLEIQQMPEVNPFFHALHRPGSLFFHPPQEIRVPSFDQKSPFKPSYAWLVAHPIPSGAQNRQRFVHSVAAMDSQMMLDGGWLLPLGQEEALREVVAAYRHLPAMRFETVADARGVASQPVTFRYASSGGRTYLYVANDAPFGITAQVQIETSPQCQLRDLSGLRRLAPLKFEGDAAYWTVDLEPYDLVAVELSEPQARPSRPQISLPGSVEAALGRRIRALGVAAAALRSPPQLRALENPGFERATQVAEPVPGWAVSRRSGVVIRSDKSQFHSGAQSVKVTSDGPIACLVSRPFPAPDTGRLSMSVWLRLENPGEQPTLRLALEGKLEGRDYYRFAAVGQSAAPGQPAVPIGKQWGQFIFQVDDLPLEGLSQLRVRIDLMNRGEVWADDIQLSELAFSEQELRALQKMITLANVTLQNGQVGDCVKLLEGYWPRFLVQNVPLSTPTVPAAEVARKPEDSPAEKPAGPSHQTGWLDRVKTILPEKLR